MFAELEPAEAAVAAAERCTPPAASDCTPEHSEGEHYLRPLPAELEEKPGSLAELAEQVEQPERLEPAPELAGRHEPAPASPEPPSPPPTACAAQQEAAPS